MSIIDQYISYTNANFTAFVEFQRTAELIARKKAILDQLLAEKNLNPISYLFVGFNPWIFGIDRGKSITLVVHDAAQREWFSTNRKDIVLCDSIPVDTKYNAVIATDEIMSFILDDRDQQQLCRDLISVCSGIVITTMRDYKNMDPRDREFSYPIAIKTNNNDTVVYLEHHQQHNSFQWTCFLYKLSQQQSSLMDSYDRRAVYFRQMAKFFTDAGGKDFYMHKNLWYKNLIKKNFEHLISITI